MSVASVFDFSTRNSEIGCGLGCEAIGAPAGASRLPRRWVWAAHGYTISRVKTGEFRQSGVNDA
jgi:hypothetical protein